MKEYCKIYDNLKINKYINIECCYLPPQFLLLPQLAIHHIPPQFFSNSTTNYPKFQQFFVLKNLILITNSKHCCCAKKCSMSRRTLIRDALEFYGVFKSVADNSPTDSLVYPEVNWTYPPVNHPPFKIYGPWVESPYHGAFCKRDEYTQEQCKTPRHYCGASQNRNAPEAAEKIAYGRGARRSNKADQISSVHSSAS